MFPRVGFVDARKVLRAFVCSLVNTKITRVFCAQMAVFFSTPAIVLDKDHPVSEDVKSRLPAEKRVISPPYPPVFLSDLIVVEKRELDQIRQMQSRIQNLLDQTDSDRSELIRLRRVIATITADKLAADERAKRAQIKLDEEMRRFESLKSFQRSMNASLMERAQKAEKEAAQIPNLVERLQCAADSNFMLQRHLTALTVQQQT